MSESLRHDWTIAEARRIHDTPVLDLLFRAQEVHRRHHAPGRVQLCSLLSIKTGACPEDCAYCPQSAHYDAGVKPEKLMDVDTVLDGARAARDAGASRFCMGAAWREVRDGAEFDSVLEMVRGVRDLGMEACVTLGMIDASQAVRLKEAGLTAYNHNLDTSRDYYGEIISTRVYDDRLRTLGHVREAGITICSGGIIGMGESIDDRCAMLVELARLDPHPESVPVNALVAVAGTPLAEREPVAPVEMARMIATARILMPASVVRLSAGRAKLSEEAQLMCFMAGANSIFFGEKLLTTGNPDTEADLAMMREAGIEPLLPEAGRPA
ncbi:MAG: biotin synthase BioB [Myxococcales bacterium]|nr:MAG: biotin synthase BioB [Myxococcales bacterium]